MPPLQLGFSSYDRAEGDLPGLPVINMVAEETASEGLVLQSRTGLVDRGANMGAGPVRELYRRDGVVSGRLLGVSGGQFYDGTTARGAVVGSGPVSIAGNEVGAMVTAGSVLYRYNGTTLAPVSFPDGAPVIKVLEGSGRFIAIRGGGGKFYWTPPLGTTFDPLAFATAESESDELLDGLFIDDALVLFGRETVEFWPNTTDDLLPFQPLQGRVLERGIRQTGACTLISGTFAWVTDRNTVCIGDERNVVSNVGLQARIAASSSVRVFNFSIAGRSYLAVRLDRETQVYSTSTQTWSEFATYGLDNWPAACAAGSVFGSGIDGRTLRFGDGYDDLGGVLERRFRAGLPINGGAFDVANLRLRANPGQTPFLTGTYAKAEIEMRMSRDAGRTWGPWIATTLGEQGVYRQRIEWRALGIASQPGLFVEFRCTDPVPLRISGAFVNEAYGGR